MSPTIPDTPHCAARSCARIDHHPSPRLAFAGFAWVVVACGFTLSATVALPVRIVICIAVATAGIRGIARFVLLRGERAVRALEWEAAGEMWQFTAGGARRDAASVAPGTFRLGPAILALRLESARGVHTVLIDGRLHDPAAYRALCRYVLHGPQVRSRRVLRGS